MKKIFISIVVLVSLSTNLFSQDKAEDLKYLFDLMQTDKTMEKVMDNMFTMMMQQTNAQHQNEQADSVQTELIKFIKQEMAELTKTFINEDMVAIYDQNFSHNEIKDLITFYQSPTGKKMIERTPAISEQSMQVMMTKHVPAFKAKIMAKTQEMAPQ